MNRARTAGTRERRSIAIGDAQPAVDQVSVRRHRPLGAAPQALDRGGRQRLDAAKSPAGSVRHRRPAGSARCVTLATSMAPARRCAACSTSARATSASCCTGAEPAAPGPQDRVREGLTMLSGCGFAVTSSASRRSSWSPTTSRARCSRRSPPLRGAPGRLPALHRVPRPDARHDRLTGQSPPTTCRTRCRTSSSRCTGDGRPTGTGSRHLAPRYPDLPSPTRHRGDGAADHGRASRTRCTPTRMTPGPSLRGRGGRGAGRCVRAGVPDPGRRRRRRAGRGRGAGRRPA